MAEAEPTTSAYVVVDFWHVRPGREAELERKLAESAVAFRQHPGVLSVDFTRVEGDPGRYLVVFRYDTAESRAAFVATSLVHDALNDLADLWDLDGQVWRGEPL
jgi:heme-degrading monooxygenase HmoA